MKKKNIFISVAVLACCLAVGFFTYKHFSSIKKNAEAQPTNNQQSAGQGGQDIAQFAAEQKQAVASDAAAQSGKGGQDIAQFAAAQQASGAAAQPAGKSIPIPKDQVPSVKPQDVVASGTVPYSNSQYGFQVMLPKGWDKYKAEADSGKIVLSLPTTDATFNGYAPVIDVLVFSLDDWQKYLDDCQKNPSPNCYSDQSVTAKSSSYVFIVTTPDDLLPADLSPLDPKGIMNDYVEIIKQSFKIQN